MAVPHVRGQLFQASLEYVHHRHGAPTVQEVVASLAEDDRLLVRGLDREGWYTLGALARLSEAIARVVGGAEELVFEELGAASARHRTEWLGRDARLVNVHAFLSRVADEHRLFHDFGRAVYTRGGFHAGELAFSEYPEVYASFCRASLGYLRTAVELLTGGGATVVEAACQGRGDDACRYVVLWSGPGA